MRATYKVIGENITLSGGGSNTLVFINPAAAPNVGIRILSAWASQHGTATSQQIGIKHVSQVTAFPTLTSATPAKVQRHNPNASVITGGTAGAAGTCGINASAEGGTKTTIWADAFNNLNGYLWTANQNQGPIELPAGSTSGYGLVLLTSPTTATNWDFGIEYEEF
jgi:hypothetical protein